MYGTSTNRTSRQVIVVCTVPVLTLQSVSQSVSQYERSVRGSIAYYYVASYKKPNRINPPTSLQRVPCPHKGTVNESSISSLRHLFGRLSSNQWKSKIHSNTAKIVLLVLATLHY